MGRATRHSGAAATEALAPATAIDRWYATGELPKKTKAAAGPSNVKMPRTAADAVQGAALDKEGIKRLVEERAEELNAGQGDAGQGDAERANTEQPTPSETKPRAIEATPCKAILGEPTSTRYKARVIWPWMAMLGKPTSKRYKAWVIPIKATLS